jgi:hypothetical protein
MSLLLQSWINTLADQLMLAIARRDLQFDMGRRKPGYFDAERIEMLGALMTIGKGGISTSAHLQADMIKQSTYRSQKLICYS